MNYELGMCNYYFGKLKQVLFLFDENKGVVCINAKRRTQTNIAIFFTSDTKLDNMLCYLNLYNLVILYSIIKRFPQAVENESY